jgi:hypothetical protein
MGGSMSTGESGWCQSQPAVGQRGRVWYFSEQLTATWNGKAWIVDDGSKLPPGLWWKPAD